MHAKYNRWCIKAKRVHIEIHVYPLLLRKDAMENTCIIMFVSLAGSIDAGMMLTWFQQQLAPYKDKVTIFDMITSWRDGLAFCALVHAFRPETM